GHWSRFAGGGRPRGREPGGLTHAGRKMNSAPIRNALTIDVEDYFHVYAFASHISRDSWDQLPCRVERNVEATLAILEEHKAHATYFMLGWVADRYHGLVRRIVEQG